MAHHDDMTAERAAAERLVNKIYGNASGRCMGPIWEEYVIATEQLIKQTRRAALLEAANAMQKRYDESYDWSPLIENTIAELKRLAQEGS